MQGCLCVCSDGFREFMHVSATRCIGVYKRMCIFHELPVSHATTIKKYPLPCYYGNRALVFLSCVPFSLSFIIFLFISLLLLHTFLPVSLFSPSCVCVCIKWRVVQKQTVWWPHQQPIGLSVAAGGLKPMGEAGRWCSRRKDAAARKPQRVPCENSAL